MKEKLIAGLLIGTAAAAGFASETDGIFSYRVGQYEVHMLVETERDGNAGILVGADDALLRRYIPADGFKHSTNTFLIKAPGQNILVDTGFGGAVFEKISALGVEPGQVDAVLLTHLHGDHIGGLQRDGRPLFPRARILVASRERNHFTGISVNQGAVAALAAYGSRVETFEPQLLGTTLRELLPGITPIVAYGHTPGHTVFLLESGRDKLLLIGDLLHVALVQFPSPNISATYDMDAAASAAMRKLILDYAAKNKIPVAGAHIVYPGIGTVEAEGNGFSFVNAR
ncbi:MAG: MBL fold metallo-hydrolase [Treponema sp.]|nr:MBL fold metallo-hydrolase [Treponema sp.]